MLKEANKTCRRLWKDESGVVLAVTIVTFLTLFVIACSVYVYGETIRERIEVQNAADAAAYTAAVVEADALSRLGAITKAMGWTYVQQCKITMDHIVDKWLIMSLMKWAKDYIKVRIRAKMSMCSLGPRTGSDDWYCGDFTHREHLLLNKHQWVYYKDIINAHKDAAGQGKSFIKTAIKSLKCSINIKGMNRAQKSIIREMEKKEEKAAKKILKANIDDMRNDKLSRDRNADIRWAFLTNPKKCFDPVGSEAGFLRSVYGRGTQAKALMGEGCDTWFVLDKGKKIGREYKQLGDRLIAEWSYHGNNWVLIPAPPGCAPSPFPKEGSGVSKAGDYKDHFYKTANPEPQELNAKYFEKDGAIVVGVARKLHNPFQFMFPHREPKGIYGLYSVPTASKGGDHYIWGVAASRAGYHDHGRPTGSYNPTVDSWEEEYDPAVKPSEAPAWWRRNHGWMGLSPYNLSETDWDAVFLPLHRAWSPRTPAWENRGPAAGVGGPTSPGQWQKETASKILDELWTKASWERLDHPGGKSHGLRKDASAQGPEGMKGKISYGKQMEDHVYH